MLLYTAASRVSDEMCNAQICNAPPSQRFPMSIIPRDATYMYIVQCTYIQNWRNKMNLLVRYR